jgi:hypothetical protein
MEENPEIFIDDTTGGEFLNRHQIVHLYQEDKGWKPTKGTESHNPGQELWWGVLLQSHKQPNIEDLRRCQFGENWKVVVEDLECTRDGLKGHYSDDVVERALEPRSY